MRKLSTLLAFAAFTAVAATGCGGSAHGASVTADEARSAVPTSSSATVGTPTDTANGSSAQAGGAAQAAASSASATFDPSFSSSSEYASVTYYTDVRVLGAVQELRAAASPSGYLLRGATNHCLNLVRADSPGSVGRGGSTRTRGSWSARCSAPRRARRRRSR